MTHISITVISEPVSYKGHQLHHFIWNCNNCHLCQYMYCFYHLWLKSLTYCDIIMIIPILMMTCIWHSTTSFGTGKPFYWNELIKKSMHECISKVATQSNGLHSCQREQFYCFLQQWLKCRNIPKYQFHQMLNKVVGTYNLPCVKDQFYWRTHTMMT